MKKKHNPEERAIRVLARVLRELLKVEQFDSLADLTDALKFRCARLRISWTNDRIGDAYRWVGSNTPLVRVVRAVPRLEQPDESPRFSRDEARHIWRKLKQADELWRKTA